MKYELFIHELTLVVELVGVAVLLVGGVMASAAFVQDWRRRGLGDAYHGYRSNLGRAILLGLEILIVADIIGTIAVEPTVQNLSVLGLIVLIRTFLSFALEIEISGRLPWHRDPLSPPHKPPVD